MPTLFNVVKRRLLSQRRRLADVKVAPLLLATALLAAGCVGGDDPQDDPSALAADPGNATPPERPDGRDGGFAAFNETNRTEAGAGGLEHAHDYWAGRERVLLLDADYGLTSCCYAAKPMAYARLRLPESSLVYEGASAVEVTLSKPERRACSIVYDAQGRMCTDRAVPRVADPAGAPAARLWVRDAASKDFRDAGAVTWDAAMVLPVASAKQTDMPHAARSLWEFEVRTEDPKDDTLHVHARIEAVRAAGVEVPKWPGHPDFYAESPVRTVLQASAVTKESGPLVVVDPAGYSVQRVPADKLVSYGTRTLHVFVNITDFKSQNPALQPSGWILVWSNASGVLRAVGGEGHGGDVTQHHWVLPVDDDGMDSPYADASRWTFSVQGQFALGTPERDVVTCTGLCSMYEAAYTIAVLATNEALPPESYSVEPE